MKTNINCVDVKRSRINWYTESNNCISLDNIVAWIAEDVNERNISLQDAFENRVKEYFNRDVYPRDLNFVVVFNDQYFAKEENGDYVF